MEYNSEWITEIESAIRSGSESQRADSLRKVTGLFLASHELFSDRQLDVFDRVLCNLVEKIETRALAELSEKLAPIANAPNDIVQKLARHDEIRVAGPVLTRSRRLSVEDLTEIASSKSQEHLLAISSRAGLESLIADILIARGDGMVISSLLKNTGATISNQGFSALIAKAEANESLAEQIGRRLDIPLNLFRELLARATAAVRAKLAAISRPESQEEIDTMISKIADDVAVEEATPRDFSVAHRSLLALKERGELNQQTVLSYVRGRKYEELVVGLALLCGLPFATIDGLMNAERADGLLIPCKSAGFDWASTKTILKNRPSWKVISESEAQALFADFVKLSSSTANRICRFWAVRERTGGIS